MVGTCFLGEEVDLSSRVLGNTKLDTTGVSCCGQDVPAVANPCCPLDLEAENTQQAFGA